MKRIFVAVNLPENLKETLLRYQEQWPDLPAHWTKKENLHITLQFLGNVSEKELEKIAQEFVLVGEKHLTFEGIFQQIVYGPTKVRPSMIWALLQEPSFLLLLQKDIYKAVSSILDVAKQPFIPHVTLAKLRQFEFQRLELEEWPIIEEEISLPFSVQSFEIMESKLNTREPEYAVIQSILLKH